MTTLPPDCPVTALGYSLDFAAGARKHHFRTAAGDLASLDPSAVSASVELLFDGHIDHVVKHWPPHGAPPGYSGAAFNRQRVADALVKASLVAGRYQPNKNGGAPLRHAEPGVTIISSAPGDTTSGPSDERSTGWNCGNGGLQARATLTLIERNAIRDPEAIEAVSSLVYEAGADFAARLIADMEVPF